MMRALPLSLAAFALTGTAAADPGSRATRDYVAAAGQSDAFELMEATTALAESKDPQVQAFAGQMLADHHRTAQALTEATAQAGLAPPPTIPGADQDALLYGLQGLRGADFDKTFWKQQALAHRSALVTTQGYATNGDTPAIRQAAQAAVPIIALHLATAERMVAATGL